MYKLGAVGLGHWFERLHEGMKSSNNLLITKAVGTSSLDKKLSLLSEFDIPPQNYYIASKDGKIPEEFYSDIDIVHISDPNELHASQLIEALNHKKKVVVEKAIATNQIEFKKVIDFIESTNNHNNVYLHLHYLHKLLTMQLPSLLVQITKNEGKIIRIESIFFEEENLEDTRRSGWLFAPQSGGLFMDWIHPFEVIIKGAGASKINLEQIKQFEVNSKYTTTYPTGIWAQISVNGEHFTVNAQWISKVAKGVKQGEQRKKVMLTFESGSVLELNYKNSEMEFNSNERGSWNLYDKNGNVVESKVPTGPTASQLLVEDILKLCENKGPMLKLSDIKTLFEPQWAYQRLSQSAPIIKDKNQIDLFIHGKML